MRIKWIDYKSTQYARLIIKKMYLIEFIINTINT